MGGVKRRIQRDWMRRAIPFYLKMINSSRGELKRTLREFGIAVNLANEYNALLEVIQNMKGKKPQMNPWKYKIEFGGWFKGSPRLTKVWLCLGGSRATTVISKDYPAVLVGME